MSSSAVIVWVDKKGDVAATDDFGLAAVLVNAFENIRSLVDSEVVAACGALTLDIEVVGVVD